MDDNVGTAPPVESRTVASLVRQAQNREDDPWELALVQRDKVWDWVRVARLMDSLLAGYPIGTLLLVRLRGDDDDLVPALDPKERTARDVPRRRWQLLDGQQRLNAIAALYSSVPEHGRYYLDLTAERPSESELATRRRQRIAATNYIRFRRASLSEEYYPIDGRGFHLDLSRFAAWVGSDDVKAMRQLMLLAGEAGPAAAMTDVHGLLTAALERAESADTASADLRSELGFLREIDSECQIGDASVVRDSQLARVAERAAHLLASWFSEVPVERKVLASEFDILQVFERINLAGVRVAGEDVFFAAIKTRWPQADERLRAFTADVRCIGHRRSALRLLSRLASLADGRGDLLPLRVDRLNPPHGPELRKRVELLAGEGAPRRRMAAVSHAVTHKSGLGYATHDDVPGVHIDAVLGWAATSSRAEDPAWVEQSLPAVSAFLLGATAFGYWRALGTGFAELAMAEAVRAGSSGEPFPAEAIVARTVDRFGESLTRRFVAVRDDTSDAARLEVVNANRRLFLAIAHQLPFDLPARTRHGVALDGQVREIEWDHIWPQHERQRFRYGRRYQPGSSRVGDAGNFWVLDAPLNNYARAQLPATKFEFLDDPSAVRRLPDLWPQTSEAVLTTEERQHLLRIESMVRGERTEQTVATAAQEFADLVERRGLRLFDLVAQDDRFGQWRLYARSAAGAVDVESPEAGSRRLGGQFANALGLPPPSRTRPATSEGTSSGGLAAEADRAGVAEDLAVIEQRARELGFHVATRRTYRKPYRYHLALALDRAGWRRRDLCTIRPDEDQRAFRVSPSGHNLRVGLHLDPPAVWSLFGAEGDRLWDPGSGASFVNEVLEHLATVSRSDEPSS